MITFVIIKSKALASSSRKSRKKQDVILELEMLYEKKSIIGYQTSLSKYCLIFGSNFEQIDFRAIKLKK